MATAKTATLTVHNQPKLKAGVRIVSVDDNRFITNMIAVMIRDYCRRVGIR